MQYSSDVSHNKHFMDSLAWEEVWISSMSTWCTCTCAAVLTTPRILIYTVTAVSVTVVRYIPYDVYDDGYRIPLRRVIRNYRTRSHAFSNRSINHASHLLASLCDRSMFGDSSVHWRMAAQASLKNCSSLDSTLFEQIARHVGVNIENVFSIQPPQPFGIPRPSTAININLMYSTVW